VNFKTHNWNLQKSPSDILPVNTTFLNLEKEEKELFANMKPKTRYNIRYSLRKGVKVREYGPEKIDEWYRLYSETAVRNNLTLHQKDYFSSLFLNNGENDNGVKVSLLMADFEGMFLSAMILVLSGQRATYLYGASSSEKRNLMATYVVQWKAINIAQSYNCTEYDMFGTAPNGNRSHPMHGLHRYKTGFGGSLFHRMGCWDYPYMTGDYKLLKAQEVNNQSYRLQVR
jgi:lipid II:glycine glycyltransferase (peptidoglycan interpeptide bridge formation enzyme)